MRTKTSETANVLDTGKLAKQFAAKAGRRLVDDLASWRHGTWTFGEIQFTDSHGLNVRLGSPQKIVHFCVP